MPRRLRAPRVERMPRAAPVPRTASYRAARARPRARAARSAPRIAAPAARARRAVRRTAGAQRFHRRRAAKQLAARGAQCASRVRTHGEPALHAVGGAEALVELGVRHLEYRRRARGVVVERILHRQDGARRRHAGAAPRFARPGEHDRGQGRLTDARREPGEPVEFRGQSRPCASRAGAGLRRRGVRALRCNGLAIHGLSADCDAVLFIEGIPALFPGQPHVKAIMCTTRGWRLRIASQLSRRAPELHATGYGT